MRSWPLWVAVGALGCAPRVELIEVPIVGGTSEARRAAQAELERFDAWIGAGRLRIREIRFEENLDRRVDDLEIRGLWRSGRDIVFVDNDVPPYDVADVVRHELCHALDSMEELSAGSDVLRRLDQAYSHLPSPEGEGFAQVCDVGPLAAAVATAVRCQGDDPDLVSAFSFLAENVWTGAVSLDPAPPVGPRLGGFDLDLAGEPVSSWTILPTIDPDRLTLLLELAESGVAELDVDFTTGERLSNEHLEHLPESADPPPGLGYGDPFVLAERGWPEGPGAAALTFPVLEQPLLPPRLVVHDGEQWQPVEGSCPGEEGADFGLFTAQHRFWYAWDDGEAIYWAPLALP